MSSNSLCCLKIALRFSCPHFSALSHHFHSCPKGLPAPPSLSLLGQLVRFNNCQLCMWLAFIKINILLGNCRMRRQEQAAAGRKGKGGGRLPARCMLHSARQRHITQHKKCQLSATHKTYLSCNFPRTP